MHESLVLIRITLSNVGAEPDSWGTLPGYSFQKDL